MRFLLDTNVLSEVLRPVPATSVLARIAEVGDDAATAAPVWHELSFGRDRLPAGKRRRAIDAFLGSLRDALPVLPYDAEAALWHARERARLAKAGRPAPFVDGQIAAIAATQGLTLVTRNVRDFAAFRGLAIESWH